MIFGSLILLLIIPLILLFTIGIPIIIGVCVYRDAENRVDCNPWLWALVAMLVPSYIGLIVYLIIRNDYPKMNVADNRGASSTENSQNTYYQQGHDNPGNMTRNTFPTWAKAVLIIVAVIIGICIVSMVGTVVYHIVGFNGIPAICYY